LRWTVPKAALKNVVAELKKILVNIGIDKEITLAP
jgi:hypothetical protein